MTSDRRRFLQIGKDNEQSEIECLQRLVHLPTCYHKKHDMKPIINQLTLEFQERGYTVRVFPTTGTPVLVAELDQGLDKTLLFYNHYDVQPEEPLDEWNTPPYELSLKDDRLYGRGVADNKGPLVANIFGIQNVSAAGYELGCNIRFIIEGEEEAGSPHLEEFCKAHPDLLSSDGCVWEWAIAVPDQRSKIYTGVKGDVYFELRSKGVYKDAHSGNAAVIVNPAWRLTWALATLKNAEEEILIDGFYDAVIAPSSEELALLSRYPSDEIEQYKDLYKIETFLRGRQGVEFWKELILSPACSICGLSAGWEGPGAKTVIGKEAMAKVDFRLVPNQKAEDIQKLLRKHLDKHGFSDIMINLCGKGYEPNRTAINHPFIELLTNLATSFSGIEPLLLPSSPGSGPAYLFGTHTPWAMVDIFDPATNTHAPNESMRLHDFRYMTAFIAALTVELGKT